MRKYFLYLHHLSFYIRGLVASKSVRNTSVFHEHTGNSMLEYRYSVMHHHFIAFLTIDQFLIDISLFFALNWAGDHLSIMLSITIRFFDGNACVGRRLQRDTISESALE